MLRSQPCRDLYNQACLAVPLQFLRLPWLSTTTLQRLMNATLPPKIVSPTGWTRLNNIGQSFNPLLNKIYHVQVQCRIHSSSGLHPVPIINVQARPHLDNWSFILHLQSQIRPIVIMKVHGQLQWLTKPNNLLFIQCSSLWRPLHTWWYHLHSCNHHIDHIIDIGRMINVAHTRINPRLIIPWFPHLSLQATSTHILPSWVLVTRDISWCRNTADLKYPSW